MSRIKHICLVFLTLISGVMLALVVLPVAAAPDNTILYAAPTPNGAGDCSSWADVCTLQTALTIAVSDDQIWVQAGIHKPGTTVSNTFALVNGVAVYGGFVGTETQLDQRDWETNLTVLSGDIDNNDLTDPNGVVTDTDNIVGENAYHVVSSTVVLSDTVLDGFIITAGQADDYLHSSNLNGAGMYNWYSSPTLKNLVFSGNAADDCMYGCLGDGGGMYNWYSNPTLTNITFNNNKAIEYGGGMYNNHSSPTLTNITFSGNMSGWCSFDDCGGGGGGMANLENSNPILTEITFSNNTTFCHGGGIHSANSRPTLTNVIFSGNTAGCLSGGGMSNYNSNPTLTNVIFSDNTGYGGGMVNSNSSPALTNVIFSRNTAVDGGGMYNNNSNPTLMNVTFSENVASLFGGGSGGGMNNNNSNPILMNVTFSGNSADDDGGGMRNYNSNPTLTNVILWENTAPDSPQISNDNSTPTLSYSDIEGSGGSGAGWDPTLGIDGGGNIDADPLFVDAVNGDLHLDLTSPAIDAGNNLSVTVTTDLDGNPRFVDIPTVPDTGNGTPPIVDMGAYEAQTILYAVPDGLTNGSCETWANACTLTYTLSIAISGDQIWVQMGLHKPGATVSDTFALVDGVAVYGGFNGTETQLNERDWETNVTVLSGDIDNNDLTDPNGVVTDTDNIVGYNSYHVVTSTSVLSDTVLDGFVITAGQDIHSTYPFNNKGGGMYNNSSSPTLTNLLFSGNNAGVYYCYELWNHIGEGGAMYNSYSNPILTNVTFSGNTACFGGGMYNSSSSPILTNVTFSGNTTALFCAFWSGIHCEGGGMFNYQSSPTLTNVTFSGNTADYGGGMSNWGNSPNLTNVTFSGNSANWGGGMSNEGSDPTLTNVTFSENTGGGMYNHFSNPTLMNLIFSGNIGNGIYNQNSNPTLTNVTFSDNSATWGGGMYNDVSNPTLTNVTFTENTADNMGGGMFNGYSNPMLTNVTFSGNTAQWGGGIYNWHTSNPILTNTILWGNEATNGPQIYNNNTTPVISFSDIEDSGGSGAGWDPTLGTDGGGNIDADPLFVDAVNGDLHLDLTSPAIDAGNNLSVTVTTDLDGNPRFMDIPTIPDTGNGTPPIVDMGAYEAQPGNFAPLFTSTPVTTATQDVPYTYTILTLDLNGDAVTITAPTLPTWLTLTDHGDETATLTGTPTNAEVGDHAVLLRVTDSGGLYSEQPFILTVANVNDAPIITSTPITTAAQDAPYTYILSTTDPDLLYGDALTLTAPTLPVWLTFMDNGDGTAVLAGTPTSTDVGMHTVVLRVTDAGGLFVEQTFILIVTEGNFIYFIYLPIAISNAP